MSEIRVNNIIDEAGTGAPTLPNGVTIQGNTTGTNLTLSGDLTVNGTTTTIDTAVTAVDSLAVDGNITAGSAGIGTANPATLFEVRAGGGIENVIRVKSGDDTQSLNIGVNTSAGGSHIFESLNNALRLGTNDTERLRILADGTVATGILTATPSTVAAGSIVQVSANAGFFNNGYDGKFGTSSNHPVYIQVNGSSKLTIATNGDLTSTGIISDSIGPLRRLGVQGASGSFSFAADMAGKLVRSTGNGSTLTIPQNIFSAGDMISVFNVSTGNNTIETGAGTTLYNTADGATGNRTLGAKGVCTIVCTSTNEFIISGTQIS